MEKKYDSYFEEEIPYTETLEELHNSNKDGYITERHLLAYIRSRGEKFTCIARVNVPKTIIQTPLGAVAMDDNYQSVPCKIVLDRQYNPLKSYISIEEDHWYGPYKIQFTPSEFNGFVETMYFSDFCSHVNSGDIIITED